MDDDGIDDPAPAYLAPAIERREAVTASLGGSDPVPCCQV